VVAVQDKEYQEVVLLNTQEANSDKQVKVTTLNQDLTPEVPESQLCLP
jgi:hypothetical protein